MHTAYQYAKDFAGPMATVIAAVAATGITYLLGRNQTKIASAQKEIAQSQRDIAYDRLKYDLFKERYGIYVAAKHLIEKISGNGFPLGIHDPELRAMRIRLDEARFFFPPRETRLFSHIETLAAEHEGARSVMEKTNNETDRRKAEDMATEKLRELARAYETLTPDMEPELGFTQLTRRAPGKEDFHDRISQG
jgi:hypothetical protein